MWFTTHRSHGHSPTSARGRARTTFSTVHTHTVACTPVCTDTHTYVYGRIRFLARSYAQVSPHSHTHLWTSALFCPDRPPPRFMSVVGLPHLLDVLLRIRQCPRGRGTQVGGLLFDCDPPDSFTRGTGRPYRPRVSVQDPVKTDLVSTFLRLYQPSSTSSQPGGMGCRGLRGRRGTRHSHRDDLGTSTPPCP